MSFYNGKRLEETRCCQGYLVVDDYFLDFAGDEWNIEIRLIAVLVKYDLYMSKGHADKAWSQHEGSLVSVAQNEPAQIPVILITKTTKV